MSSFEDGAKEPQRESLDLGLSNLDPESWKTESPHDLWPAITAQRRRFEKEDDISYHLTHELCCAHLHHARTGELQKLEECKERELVALVFRHLSHIPGACERFQATLRQTTPPAWFRAYLDAYMNLLTVSARGAFKNLLDIGQENESRLSSRPVAWAEGQVKHMIRSHRNSITGWIRGVCWDPAMTLDEQIGWQRRKCPATSGIQIGTLFARGLRWLGRPSKRFRSWLVTRRLRCRPSMPTYRQITSCQ